jgi:hypothetical protein
MNARQAVLVAIVAAVTLAPAAATEPRAVKQRCVGGEAAVRSSAGPSSEQRLVEEGDHSSAATNRRGC